MGMGDIAISAEIMSKLTEFATERADLAVRLLDLEQERIRVLRAASALDQKRQQFFEGLLVEHGLDPSTLVQITPSADGSGVGSMSVLDQNPSIS